MAVIISPRNRATPRTPQINVVVLSKAAAPTGAARRAVWGMAALGIILTPPCVATGLYPREFP